MYPKPTDLIPHTAVLIRDAFAGRNVSVTNRNGIVGNRDFEYGASFMLRSYQKTWQLCETSNI